MTYEVSLYHGTSLWKYLNWYYHGSSVSHEDVLLKEESLGMKNPALVPLGPVFSVLTINIKTTLALPHPVRICSGAQGKFTFNRTIASSTVSFPLFLPSNAHII